MNPERSQKVTQLHNITGMERRRACELLLAHDWDVERALRAHVTPDNNAESEMLPPRRRATPAEPAPVGPEAQAAHHAGALEAEKLRKVQNNLCVDVTKARELLIMHDWDLEQTVRAHVRSQHLLQMTKDVLVPPPPTGASTQLDINTWRSSFDLGMVKSCYDDIGDEIFAFYGSSLCPDGEWHAAQIYAVLPGSQIQVLWRDDGTVSILPAHYIAKRGKRVDSGNSVIAHFDGGWYAATVNGHSPMGVIEVCWDDGTISEVPRLHTFRIPDSSDASEE